MGQQQMDTGGCLDSQLLESQISVDIASQQQNAIAIATIQVEVEHLKLAVADLKTTNAQLNEKLDEVLRTMHEAQGGWRTLMVVGGAAASAGGFVSWLLTQWKT